MKNETVDCARRHRASPRRSGRSVEHRTPAVRPRSTAHSETTTPRRTLASTVDPLPVSSEGCATFNVKEVATLLGVGRDAVYAAANRNEIPGIIRLGGRLLFARAKVLAWLGAPAPSEPNADADANTSATLTKPTRVIGTGKSR